MKSNNNNAIAIVVVVYLFNEYFPYVLEIVRPDEL